MALLVFIRPCLSLIAFGCVFGPLGGQSVSPLAESAAAAHAVARPAAFAAFVDALAADATLSPDDRLHHAWTGYLLATTDAERGRVLAFAATLPDVRARMLIGSFREFPALRSAYAAADHAHTALLAPPPAPAGTDPKKRRAPRDLFGSNAFDAPFTADRWDDPHGVVGRWQDAAGCIDLVAYPAGNFLGSTSTGKLIGFRADDTLRLVGPAHTATVRLRADTLTLTVPGAAAPRTLRRTTVGRTHFERRPSGARVLLDATTGLRHFRHSAATSDAAWKLLPDGVTEIDPARGSLFTRETFTDVRVYVEFRHAYNSEGLGPRRGNSGLYLQNAYELQLVDSFGLPPDETSAGSLYHLAVPRVSAAAPPLEWQSLEVDFCAARFDTRGRKTTSARLSAWLNGTLLHDNIAVPHPTAASLASARLLKDPTAPQPLMLQSHGNVLQFRNIWVLTPP